MLFSCCTRPKLVSKSSFNTQSNIQWKRKVARHCIYPLIHQRQHLYNFFVSRYVILAQSALSENATGTDNYILFTFLCFFLITWFAAS